MEAQGGRVMSGEALNGMECQDAPSFVTTFFCPAWRGKAFLIRNKIVTVLYRKSESPLGQLRNKVNFYASALITK